jgi:hypothetical protein
MDVDAAAGEKITLVVARWVCVDNKSPILGGMCTLEICNKKSLPISNI